ncbi:MAG: HEAT repeat domain-containing protein [Polyangiaceae bacterium]|nr:HEAT repeat domain-containing protein [Polyangiaceae bacterium]
MFPFFFATVLFEQIEQQKRRSLCVFLLAFLASSLASAETLAPNSSEKVPQARIDSAEDDAAPAAAEERLNLVAELVGTTSRYGVRTYHSGTRFEVRNESDALLQSLSLNQAVTRWVVRELDLKRGGRALLLEDRDSDYRLIVVDAEREGEKSPRLLLAGHLRTKSAERTIEIVEKVGRAELYLSQKSERKICGRVLPGLTYRLSQAARGLVPIAQPLLSRVQRQQATKKIGTPLRGSKAVQAAPLQDGRFQDPARAELPFAGARAAAGKSPWNQPFGTLLLVDSPLTSERVQGLEVQFSGQRPGFFFLFNEKNVFRIEAEKGQLDGFFSLVQEKQQAQCWGLMQPKEPIALRELSLRLSAEESQVAENLAEASMIELPWRLARLQAQEQAGIQQVESVWPRLSAAQRALVFEWAQGLQAKLAARVSLLPLLYADEPLQAEAQDYLLAHERHATDLLKQSLRSEKLSAQRRLEFLDVLAQIAPREAVLESIHQLSSARRNLSVKLRGQLRKRLRDASVRRFYFEELGRFEGVSRRARVGALVAGEEYFEEASELYQEQLSSLLPLGDFEEAWLLLPLLVQAAPASPILQAEVTRIFHAAEEPLLSKTRAQQKVALRFRVLEALGSSPGSQEWWWRQLSFDELIADKNPRVRAEATSLVSIENTEASLLRLKKLAKKDPYPLVRRRALQALASVVFMQAKDLESTVSLASNEDWEEFFLRRLRREPDPDVRRVTIRLLKDRTTAQVADGLLRALKKDDALSVRTLALKKLSRRCDARVLSFARSRVMELVHGLSSEDGLPLALASLEALLILEPEERSVWKNKMSAAKGPYRAAIDGVFLRSWDDVCASLR